MTSQSSDYLWILLNGLTGYKWNVWESKKKSQRLLRSYGIILRWFFFFSNALFASDLCTSYLPALLSDYKGRLPSCQFSSGFKVRQWLFWGSGIRTYELCRHYHRYLTGELPLTLLPHLPTSVLLRLTEMALRSGRYGEVAPAEV